MEVLGLNPNQFLMPDNYLMRSGERGTFLSFAVKGVFEVWATGPDLRDHLVREIKEGEYCGEVSLVYNVRRTASVRAITYCNVGNLSKADFDRIIRPNSEILDLIKESITNYNDPWRTYVIVSFT